MKLKIKVDCQYLDKKYKKGEVVTVTKRVGEVLSTFRYATEILGEQKGETKADVADEEPKQEEPKKPESKKKSGDK